MKRLFLVGGPMGVGKSAVCKQLIKKPQPGVYLDGDWCWNMSPFSVTDETKAMVMDNICAMLTRFLACPELRYVIFGWVLHRQEIWDELLHRLPLEQVRVTCVALTASEGTLRNRLEADVAAGLRKADAVERGLSYLPLYAGLNIPLLNTDRLTPAQAADWIQLRLK